MLFLSAAYILAKFEEQPDYAPHAWLPLWANADLMACIMGSLFLIVGLFGTFVLLLNMLYTIKRLEGGGFGGGG